MKPWEITSNKRKGTTLTLMSLLLVSLVTTSVVAEPLNRFANPPFYMVKGKRYQVLPPGTQYHKQGIASWYGPNFHGKATSSGEIYDMHAMTAASKVLPIPSYVRVTNLSNHKQIIVKINDRGPFHDGRIIDLSYAAATQLGFVKQGTARVEVDSLDSGQPEVSWSQNSKDTNPHLYLQVGAFRNQNYAKDYLKQLQQQLDIPASIESNTLQQANIYRVQLGPLKSEEQGIQLNQQLQAQGLSSGILVISSRS